MLPVIWIVNANSKYVLVELADDVDIKGNDDEQCGGCKRVFKSFIVSTINVGGSRLDRNIYMKIEST